MEQVFLSRRNLTALLSKLDRIKNGDKSACTIVKYDNNDPKFRQTVDTIAVTAVEDDEYYTERPPGEVYPADLKENG